MSFLYFIATEAKKPDQKGIENAGLAYALEAGRCKFREVINGPEGKRGLLISRAVDFPDLKYDANAQDWKPITATSYVGKWRTKEIKPSDLQRENMVEGVSVAMADGSMWIAAHARKFIEIEPGTIIPYCTLPPDLAYVDGQWKPHKILRRFRRFAELAEEYQAAAYAEVEKQANAGDVIRFEFAGINDLAVGAITANYYASHAELDMLELYNIEVRQRLIDAALDTATFQAWQNKKKDTDQDGSGLLSGPPALTPAEAI